MAKVCSQLRYRALVGNEVNSPKLTDLGSPGQTCQTGIRHQPSVGVGCPGKLGSYALERAGNRRNRFKRNKATSWRAALEPELPLSVAFLILGRTNHALDDVCSRSLRQLVFTSDCRRTAEGQICVARILHGGALLCCPVHARRRRGMGTWQGCYDRRD